MINEDKKTKKIVRQKLTESFIASVEGKDKPQVYLLKIFSFSVGVPFFFIFEF